jgi:hypothetical protein
MTIRGSIANLMVVACFLLITVGGPYHSDAISDTGMVPAANASVVPAREMTVERHYTMTARVRPLLFWINRSGVGGARISWIKSPAVISSQFETRNARTGIISKFSVAYGTQGPHREIPLAIVYQPRWWLEAELQLDHAAGAAGRAAGKEMPWNPFNH